MESTINIDSLSSQGEIIAKTREQLFEVVKLQLHTGVEGFTSPESFGIYKKTGGAALGVLGKDFTPTQPTFLFDQFVDAMQDVATSDLGSLKYTELKGGKKIVLSANIGKLSYKNLVGKDDQMDIKANLITGFDGYTKTALFVSVYRLICGNGMKAWRSEFNVAFKNTKGNVGKVNMLCEDLVKVMQSSEEYTEGIRALGNRKITAKEHNEFILKVTGMDPKKYNEMTKRQQSTLDKINEAVAIEMKDAGATAWALLNGITRYTNHMATKGDVNDYIYVDSGLILNEKAQKESFALLN